MSLFAYLDPGSGSVLLQTLLGGIAGAVVAVKMFGKRVFSTLAFWKKDEPEESSETTSATATQTAQRETEKEPV